MTIAQTKTTEASEGDEVSRDAPRTGYAAVNGLRMYREVHGTRLIFTERGAFLDGHDVPAQREQGIGAMLDAVGALLRGEPASA